MREPPVTAPCACSGTHPASGRQFQHSLGANSAQIAPQSVEGDVSLYGCMGET